jgi:hypothetical protein
MLFCRCVLSPFRRKPFLRMSPLGQGAALDHRVITFACCFDSLSSTQNSVIEFKTQIVIKFNF